MPYIDPHIYMVSRTTDDEANSNSESTVDIMAERTTTSSMPAITGGNRLFEMTGKILSGSSRPGNNARPATPAVTAPNRNMNSTTIDTIRADRLGCYGYWRDTSPAIDRLASESHDLVSRQVDRIHHVVIGRREPDPGRNVVRVDLERRPVVVERPDDRIAAGLLVQRATLQEQCVGVRVRWP